MQRILVSLVLLGIIAADAGVIRAQRRGPQTARYARNHRDVRAAYKEVVSEPRKSTVAIIEKDKRVALGTVVDASGYILTKASQLPEEFECKLADGRRMKAQIVGVHRDSDLAMLKVDAKELPVVKWKSGSAPLVGSFLATPGINDIPEQIGVVSVAPRKIPAPTGMLGIVIAEGESGPRVDQVMPDSSAEKAGIRVNDVVLSVNSRQTRTREALVTRIRQFHAGDRITLSIQRGGNKMEVKARLGSFAQFGGANFHDSLGGPLSERRNGFTKALQHDTWLKPNDCGGPLVNLDGEAVGINIARAGRTSSLALPASVVRPLIDDLMSGKYPPTR